MLTRRRAHVRLSAGSAKPASFPRAGLQRRPSTRFGSDLRKIVLKELVDNALDDGARVSLDYADGVWVVSDVRTPTQGGR